METFDDLAPSFDDELQDTSQYITVCNVTFIIEIGEYILEDYALRITLACLVLIIFLVAILGNIFVVAAVFLSKRLQTTTNVFVVNLAVADFLTAILLPVHASTLLSQSECYIPELLCEFVAAATLTTLGCSVISLAMIGFHRLTVLYAVLKTKPKFNNVFGTRNTVLMILFSWLYPIVLMCILVPAGVGDLGYAIQYKVCSQSTSNTSTNSDYLTLTVSLLVQVPAFVVIIVSYVFIFKMLRRHQRHMEAVMTPPKPQRVSSTISQITIVEDLPSDASDSKENDANGLAFDELDVANSSNGKPEILNESADIDPAESKQSKTKEFFHSSKCKELPRSVSTLSSTSNNSQSQSTSTVDEFWREKHNARFKQQRKITMNLFIVVCVYTICVMPSAIVYPMPRSGPVIPWLTLLLLFNVCVNPIIYALRHPTFGEVLACILKCKYKDIPEPSSFLKSSSF